MATSASNLTRTARGRDSKRRPDKGDRLYARLSARQKEVLETAATIEGCTLSDFVLTHAQEAAQQTIRDHFTLSLSERDSLAFIEALRSPWEPADALRDEIAELRTCFAE